MGEKEFVEGIRSDFTKVVRRVIKIGEPSEITVVIDPLGAEHTKIRLTPVGKGFFAGKEVFVGKGVFLENKTYPARKGVLQAGKAKEEEDEFKGALAEAFERGEHLATKILRQPEMLTATAFAKSLDLSRETVRQKVQKHEVLALKGAKQGHRFPRWQITSDGGLLPRLAELFDRLGGNAWTVYRFLLQHHPELDGKTALEALKVGRAEEVLAAAQNAGSAFS
jgi:DNA-binding transcriptional regulator YiaG